MSFTDISIRFLEYFSNKASDEEPKIVDTLLHDSIEQIQKAQPKWIQSQINYEELVEAIIKIKKILNKITFGYWTKFWSNYVSRSLYWVAQKTQKLHLWVIRNLA
jgi:hypothetical protein